MSAEQLIAISLIISALGTVITSVGVILIAMIKSKVKQVELQGNSVSLELKRVAMVYAKRTAVATKSKADIRIAEDAETLYNIAVKQNAALMPAKGNEGS